MRTVDRIRVRAPFATVFAAASTVARWPAILPHYRWVRMLDDGLVEMAAWRPFAGGFIKYPTWWVSKMPVDRCSREIPYCQVGGITPGMEAARRTGRGTRARETGDVPTWDGHLWPRLVP